MDSISYTHARNHLAEVTDRVCADHAPVLITRQGAPSVVLISFDDYRAIEETDYLFRSPRNAARLAQSLDSAANGRVQERQLIEE